MHAVIEIDRVVRKFSLFPMCQLALNVGQFCFDCFDCLDCQRLYVNGSGRGRVDGFQQCLQMSLSGFDRVRPTRGVLRSIGHYHYSVVTPVGSSDQPADVLRYL